MSPGGHAATTVVASAATAYLSGSLPLATAVALGGFFIDVDHAVDYVLFNRQWDLRPATFLRYYLEARPQRVVLALHSWELFALLVAVAWWMGWPLLWGYLGGSAMHLLLDIAFNGELLPKNIVAFYSFAYRAAHSFNGAALHGHRERMVPAKFWSAFFKGASLRDQNQRRGLPRPSYDLPLWALRTWLDSWPGIGRIAVGMARQGYDLQLTRYDERGWRATFYASGIEHSPTGATGTGGERTPRHAKQRAAWGALKKAEEGNR